MGAASHRARSVVMRGAAMKGHTAPRRSSGVRTEARTARRAHAFGRLELPQVDGPVTPIPGTRAASGRSDRLLAGSTGALTSFLRTADPPYRMAPRGRLAELPVLRRPFASQAPTPTDANGQIFLAHTY